MKQKALLIAEKTLLKNTIEAVYKKHRDIIPYEITFLEQSGHLLTLKTPDELDDSLKEWSWDKLPFHPEQFGGWKYKIIDRKANKKFQRIKEELNSGKYDVCIHCGDADQEGELLVNIVLNALRNKLPVKRYWATAQTEEKILHALMNLRDDTEDIFSNLLSAAYCRQHSDYRYGMNLSRACSLKMKRTIYCGRVKMAILAIVCKRELEILEFEPSTCYGVSALFGDEVEGMYYKEETDTEKEDAGIVCFDTEEEAQQFIDSLKSTAIVKMYDKEQVRTSPPKLFKLASVQVAAGRIGYSPKETLDIIQSLYEEGYLTYPRTDCEYLASGEDLVGMLESAACIDELYPFIKAIKQSSIERVKKSKKWINDKKMSESGHTALVPTNKRPKLDEFSREQKEIYELICRQYVSIFLPDMIQEKVTVYVDVCGKLFRAAGKKLLRKGFTEIFGMEVKSIVIPEYKVGDQIKICDYTLVTKTSKCPKRFSESELIEVCEHPQRYIEDENLKKMKLMIGTPATRADILTELIDKLKYLEKKKARKQELLLPSKLGMQIFTNLKECQICRIDMTAHQEQLLEQVRLGKLSRKEFENNCVKSVNAMVKDIKETDMKELESTKKTIGNCPHCSAAVILTSKSFYCSDYRNGCKFGSFRKILKSKPLSETEITRLMEGEIIEKELCTEKNGEKKKWKQELFYNLDEDRINFYVQKKIESQYSCPKCGKKLLENDKVMVCDKECGFLFPKRISDVYLTNEHIQNFFEKGNTEAIRNITSKNGKKYSIQLVLGSDGKIERLFPEEKLDYRCPKCNSGITRDRLSYKCKNDCGFEFFGMAAGKKLDQKHIDSFFESGNSGLIKGLKSKSGEEFSAYIVLNSDCTGTEFKFPKKRRAKS